VHSPENEDSEEEYSGKGKGKAVRSVGPVEGRLVVKKEKSTGMYVEMPPRESFQQMKIPEKRRKREEENVEGKRKRM
jgi:hypothetical protein